MQSRQVKEAPRHWLRWPSSFFFVRTSPQFYTASLVSLVVFSRGVCQTSSRGEERTSHEKETMVESGYDGAYRSRICVLALSVSV
jgi:hypothetical protein